MLPRAEKRFQVQLVPFADIEQAGKEEIEVMNRSLGSVPRIPGKYAGNSFLGCVKKSALAGWRY